MSDMRCAKHAALLGDLVDGTIDPAIRTELNAHLEVCASCRALAADLQKIRHVAGSLDPVTPPGRLWVQIAERIQADPLRGEEQARELRVTSLPAVVWRGLAVAALLVLVIGSALLFVQGGGLRSPWSTDPATSTVEPALAESVEVELQLAELHYENAITGLEQIAEVQNETLDPQLVATLEKSLVVIDQAIAESRAVLRTEPGSWLVQETLFEALRRKVSLLQDTIALVNEMRKGNELEAARIVDQLDRP